MGTVLETGFNEKLKQLKSLVFQFDKTSNETKSILLNELISSIPKKKESFVQFHHVLLCMMAYPSNESLLRHIERTASLLLEQLSNQSPLQDKLIGTGLLHTAIECNFSYQKIKHIVQYFPNQVSIHSASSNSETQKAILKQILPNVEYSKIHAGEKEFKTRIAEFHTSKQQTGLEWLLQTIEQSSPDKKTQAFLYNQLGIFIQWKVSSEIDSVSFLRGSQLPIYCHTTPLEKKISLQEIIKQKLPTPIKLSLKEKQQLIHSAKMTLFYLYRETEPFTNANEDDITLFQLDKGISIALFGSFNSKRYSLESYIGYLVLKNNIPVSYGGGWIFGERSQFGINILESFRGGESSLIICELLRVYHHYFGATRFVVKPYQFGLHNPEAIKTGAFWFYYKLGFRPENNELRALAKKEEEEKIKNPAYKSEASTLRKYTKSNVALTLSEKTYPDFDSELLSQRITNFVNSNFASNREKAINQCFKRLKEALNINTKSWKSEDIDYAKQLSILFCSYPDYKKWLMSNKKNILLLIKLKSAKTELQWIKHLQNFKAFWKLVS
ncbi:MAG TPA: hypothetical protein PKZ75_01725 [Bacteroidia bacterium]|nr:hypothetical protein [Bacteroidia bacterium]